jgi:pimeloyl-ACP methyl ester carboxylesterase
MTLRTHLDGAVFAEHLDGTPPPVLALHGWGRDRSDLLGALSGRQLISLDLPGFGSSPPPTEPWGASGYADQVAQVLATTTSEPVFVVGHSFGGRIAAHLAADHPQLVAGVVFTGAPLIRLSPAGTPPLAYRTVRALRRMRLVPESMLESARNRHGSADYRAASGVMRDVLVTVVNEDYRDQLGRIACPVAFCWGEHDTAARPDVARQAAELVEHCVLVDIVEGAGHDVHRSSPDRLGAALDTVIEAAR